MGQLLGQQKNTMFGDNSAAAQVINTGKARDQTLATYAWNLWLIAALFNIDLIVTL